MNPLARISFSRWHQPGTSLILALCIHSPAHLPGSTCGLQLSKGVHLGALGRYAGGASSFPFLSFFFYCGKTPSPPF